MPVNKPVDIFHFHNGRGGGVWSVIKNLVTFSQNPLIKNHIVHYLTTEQQKSYEETELPEAIHQIEIRYSPNDNFYHTCKKIAGLLPGTDAVIVAHDWLELGMVSQLGLPNPLVYYVHGDYDYYYQLGLMHQQVIDVMIVVAASIEKKMNELLPNLLGEIHYLPFPVPAANQLKEKKKGSVVFVGRLEEGKGYHIVQQVAQSAAKKGLQLHWHIIGSGNEEWLRHHPWPAGIPNIHYGNIPNIEVQKVLAEMEFLILPSSHEGMPVVIIEAMKAAVVPLVSDITGGIQELVINDQTGYKWNRDDVDGFVQKLEDLQDNIKYHKIASAAKSFADTHFEPYHNTKNIEECILTILKKPRRKKIPKKLYGSRLDNKFIPNAITHCIRNICK